MFRPIRMDHTNCLQVAIKTLQFNYTLTLDDGFYTVNALNARIQQFCIEKGMYLTDGSGNNVYYLSITPNSTAYANQIITKLIPISGTGYTEAGIEKMTYPSGAGALYNFYSFS
jgi:hypothetical protein